MAGSPNHCTVGWRPSGISRSKWASGCSCQCHRGGANRSGEATGSDAGPFGAEVVVLCLVAQPDEATRTTRTRVSDRQQGQHRIPGGYQVLHVLISYGVLTRRFGVLGLGAIVMAWACSSSKPTGGPAKDPEPAAQRPVDETTLLGYRRHDERPMHVLVEVRDPVRLLASIMALSLLDVGSPEEPLDLATLLGEAGVPKGLIDLVDGAGRWVLETDYPPVAESLRMEVPTQDPAGMLNLLAPDAPRRSADEIELALAASTLWARAHDERVVFGSTPEVARAKAPRGLEGGDHLRLALQDVASARGHLLADAGVDVYADTYGWLDGLLGRVETVELAAALSSGSIQFRVQVDGALGAIDEGLVGRPLTGPGTLERALPSRPAVALVASVGEAGAVRRLLHARGGSPSLARDPNMRALSEALDELLELVDARVGLFIYVFGTEDPVLVFAAQVRSGEEVQQRLDPLLHRANERIEADAGTGSRYEHELVRGSRVWGHRFALEVPPGASAGAALVLAGNELRAAVMVVDEVAMLALGRGVDRLVTRLDGVRKGKSLAASLSGFDPYGEIEGGCQLCAITFDREVARLGLAQAVQLDDDERRHARRMLARLPEGIGGFAARLDVDRLSMHYRYAGPLMERDEATMQAWRTFGEAVRGDAGFAGRLRSLFD